MNGSAALRKACIVTVPGLFWCSVAHSHHSAAVFDSAREIELRGVVVDFKLRSPHATFVIDVPVLLDGKPRDGAVERWEIESQSLPMLRTLGIDERTFEPGDEITILAWPHRDPRFKFAHALLIADAFGSEYVMASSSRIYSPSLRRAAAAATGEPVSQEAAGVASSAAGIAKLQGRWQQPLTPFPAEGPGLPLNEQGMAAWRGYEVRESPANTCEQINVPDIFFAPFFLFELQLDARQAMLHNEAYDVVRVVPLSGEPSAADPRGVFGTVRGRVNGEALVLESSAFPPSKWGLGLEEAHGGADIPSSEQKTIVERFSVSPDGRTLVYEYTLDDPTYMTKSHVGRVELTRVPDDEPMYPYDCDLESASMWSRSREDAPLRVGDEQ